MSAQEAIDDASASEEELIVPGTVNTVSRFDSVEIPPHDTRNTKCNICRESHYGGGDCVMISMYVDMVNVCDLNTTQLFVRPQTDHDCALLGWTVWHAFQRLTFLIEPEHAATQGLRGTGLLVVPSGRFKATEFLTQLKPGRDRFISWFREHAYRSGKNWNQYIFVSFGLNMEDVRLAQEDHDGFREFQELLENPRKKRRNLRGDVWEGFSD
ncbi:MAG: hypothetical protein Q9227_008912 [Pyrenula ochraceoflavens]